MHENQETSLPTARASGCPAGEGGSRTSGMHGDEESDRAVIPMKPSNQATGQTPETAEKAAGRARTKEDVPKARAVPAQEGTAASQRSWRTIVRVADGHHLTLRHPFPPKWPRRAGWVDSSPAGCPVPGWCILTRSSVLPVPIQGKSRMRQSRSYGSVRVRGKPASLPRQEAGSTPLVFRRCQDLFGGSTIGTPARITQCGQWDHVYFAGVLKNAR